MNERRKIRRAVTNGLDYQDDLVADISDENLVKIREAIVDEVMAELGFEED